MRLRLSARACGHVELAQITHLATPVAHTWVRSMGAACSQPAVDGVDDAKTSSRATLLEEVTKLQAKVDLQASDIDANRQTISKLQAAMEAKEEELQKAQTFITTKLAAPEDAPIEAETSISSISQVGEQKDGMSGILSWLTGGATIRRSQMSKPSRALAEVVVPSISKLATDVAAFADYASEPNNQQVCVTRPSRQPPHRVLPPPSTERLPLRIHCTEHAQGRPGAHTGRRIPTPRPARSGQGAARGAARPGSAADRRRSDVACGLLGDAKASDWGEAAT